jgi:hypothetical protein
LVSTVLDKQDQQVVEFLATKSLQAFAEVADWGSFSARFVLGLAHPLLVSHTFVPAA